MSRIPQTANRAARRCALVSQWRRAKGAGEISAETWVWRVLVLCDYRLYFDGGAAAAFLARLRECDANEIGAMWVFNRAKAEEFFEVCRKVLAGESISLSASAVESWRENVETGQMSHDAFAVAVAEFCGYSPAMDAQATTRFLARLRECEGDEIRLWFEENRAECEAYLDACFAREAAKQFE